MLDKKAQNKDGRRERGDASRRVIVEAAISCIASNGLRGATLERVAQQAGVSRALLLFHYKSKDGLLIAVLEHLGNRYSAGWDVLTTDDGAPVNERLLRLIDYDVGFAVEQPEYLSVWYAFWGEAKGSNLYREISFPRDRRYGSDLGDLVKMLIEEGGYADLDPRLVGSGLTAMLFGFWLDEHLNSASGYRENAMRTLGVFLHGIFPRHFPAPGQEQSFVSNGPRQPGRSAEQSLPCSN